MPYSCFFRQIFRLVMMVQVLLLAVPAAAAPPATRTTARAGEVRGIWVTRWDYRTERDVQRAVHWSASLGLNHVFFQVRGRADAFYRSNIEPWGEEIGGRDPGFDPLETAIKEARRCGVELHAWINLLPAWKGRRSPRNRNHLLHTHPEWFLVDRGGKRHLLDASDYTILNPCLPQVRKYLVSVVTDIVSRYPVDGIQLDYARFTARDTARGEDFPYDPATLSLFRKYSGAYPSTAPEKWDRFRLLSVNTLVYRVAQAARSARPGCQVSVAAIADYRRARNALFQDALQWQNQGWVDAVYPMAYTTNSRTFANKLRDALRGARRGRVVAGIGSYLHYSAAQTTAQIDIARKYARGGYCLFAYASFFPSPSHEFRTDEASRVLRSAQRSALFRKNGGRSLSPAVSRTPASARDAAVVTHLTVPK